MGRTWAPSPLSFPACDNDDGFEEGEIIDIAMPIRIPLVDRLWDRGHLYLPFVKCVGLEEVRTGLRGLSLGMEDLRNWLIEGCVFKLTSYRAR